MHRKNSSSCAASTCNTTPTTRLDKYLGAKDRFYVLQHGFSCILVCRHLNVIRFPQTVYCKTMRLHIESSDVFIDQRTIAFKFVVFYTISFILACQFLFLCTMQALTHSRVQLNSRLFSQYLTIQHTRGPRRSHSFLHSSNHTCVESRYCFLKIFQDCLSRSFHRARADLPLEHRYIQRCLQSRSDLTLS